MAKALSNYVKTNEKCQLMQKAIRSRVESFRDKIYCK